MEGIRDVGLKTFNDNSVLQMFLSSRFSALTRSFTFPTECTTTYLQRWPDLVSASLSYTSYISGTDQQYFTRCVPSGTASFSPGVCPDGQHLATITQYQASGGASETLWMGFCCGHGFTLDSREKYCLSTLMTDLTLFRPVMTIAPDNGISEDWRPGLNTTVVSKGWKAVERLAVFWQSSDLFVFDPPYAYALASRLFLDFTPTGSMALSSTSATPASSPNLPEQTSTSETSTSGLSTGAKTGISIGAVCGVAILAAAAFLLYRHVTRRKRSNGRVEQGNDVTVEAPELLGIENPAQCEKYRREDEASVIHELPSLIPEHGALRGERVVSSLSELSSPVAELEGGEVRDRDGIEETMQR